MPSTKRPLLLLRVGQHEIVLCSKFIILQPKIEGQIGRHIGLDVYRIIRRVSRHGLPWKIHRDWPLISVSDERPSPRANSSRLIADRWKISVASARENPRVQSEYNEPLTDLMVSALVRERCSIRASMVSDLDRFRTRMVMEEMEVRFFNVVTSSTQSEGTTTMTTFDSKLNEKTEMMFVGVRDGSYGCSCAVSGIRRLRMRAVTAKGRIR